MVVECGVICATLGSKNCHELFEIITVTFLHKCEGNGNLAHSVLLNYF